jgi:transcriptional regulator with XRE-family HTH domain
VKETADQRLAYNMRVLRKRKGLSQAALAAEMRERGHPWHQQTVVRAENAARVLPLLEAHDLAEVLETTLDRLTRPSGEAQAVESLDAAAHSVYVAREAIADGVTALLSAVAAVRAHDARYEHAVSPLVQGARTDARDRIAVYGDVGAAVEEGIRRYEERPGTHMTNPGT